MAKVLAGGHFSAPEFPRRSGRVTRSLSTVPSTGIFARRLPVDSDLSPGSGRNLASATGRAAWNPMLNTLILASRSRIRAKLLEAAGVQLEIVPSRVDEAAVKEALRTEGAPPRDVADALASLKAARVSARHPERLVLGADQVLAIEGRIYDKPSDLDEARLQLRALRGKAHTLLSAVVVFEGSRPVWRHVGTARLNMRAFSDAFLEQYLSRYGEDLLDSVGAYKLEDGGAALFDRVEGDYFSVLGLPLLEVLSYLRVRQVIPE